MEIVRTGTQVLYENLKYLLNEIMLLFGKKCAILIMFNVHGSSFIKVLVKNILQVENGGRKYMQ